jgi:predicted MFS family arabinose efflux permease
VKDIELAGKRIAKGDTVVMWYASGNRDETAIERAHEFIIDRDRPRQHCAFGFGIHRCVGNRLAEMQLRVLWEEILKRYPVIEVVGEPVRLANPFIKGYASLPVRIPPTEAQPARPAATEAARPHRPRPQVYRQPLSVLLSASTVSAAAALLFNVMPVLLAAAGARFNFNESQIGVVGSSYLGGFALVATTSNLWINRFIWRAIVAAATAVSVAGLAACAAVRSYPALLAMLVLSGAALGVLYTVCIAVVSEHHRPDPAFGVKLTAEVALGIVALLALSSFVTARWGFTGDVLTLAALVGAVSLAGLPGMPAGRARTPPEKRFAMTSRAGAAPSVLRDWAPWLGVAALFVSFAGMSALWAFISQLAPGFGISSQAADNALTTSLFFSGAAGLGAVFLGDKLGRARPLALGMLLAIAGVAVLQWGHGYTGYLAGLVLAVGLWNFPMSYQMGIIASSDGRGNVAVLMPAALALGGALGPLLAGSLLAGAQGYLPLYALFAGATAVSLAAFLVLGRRLAHGRL